MSTNGDGPIAGTSRTPPEDRGIVVEEPFDFQVWLTASKLTEAGRKKLTLNAIVDYESLVYVTDRDIWNYLRFD